MTFSEHADKELSLEESGLDLLFEVSVMEKGNPLDTIYKYTESHIKAQEDSLNRLDLRFSTFIGFAGVLIRLAIDLPENTNHCLKIGVCLFGTLTILFSAVGLTAKQTGGAAHPEILMKDDWFEKEEAYHQAYIINGWIEVIREYEKIAKIKGQRLNLIVVLFTIATTLYAIDVGLATSF